MKKESRFQNILAALYHYFIFFLLVSFIITCCMLLFVSALSSSLEITLADENLAAAARLTFGNVLLLSFLIASCDALRRKLTVDRPVRQITEGAKKIMLGNFHVRLMPARHFAAAAPYNEIIACFNEMAEELQSVETLRTDFIANVSHEMKTPLAVMQNFAALLQTPNLPEEKRLEYARGITDNVRRMADMMTNILRLNRLENQKIYPQASEYDLGEQLCACLLQYESVWERSEIEIETEIAENVTIKADAELLSLVWNNLFSNAFKFTPPGGIVSVSLTATAQHAIVKVKDTGCGISPEVGAHIFEKFYQGDTSHSVQGNGLGLALVKRVVDIMQGEISVESSKGAGSVFTVKIRRG